MLALADVMHFLAHELARLRRGGFSFTLAFSSPSNRFFLRHVRSLRSPALCEHHLSTQNIPTSPIGLYEICLGFGGSGEDEPPWTGQIGLIHALNRST